MVSYAGPMSDGVALIVEDDDILSGSLHVGDDEANARNKLARVPLDLGDDSAWGPRLAARSR